jgi:hypothetical protein
MGHQSNVFDCLHFFPSLRSFFVSEKFFAALLHSQYTEKPGAILLTGGADWKEVNGGFVMKVLDISALEAESRGGRDTEVMRPLSKVHFADPGIKVIPAGLLPTANRASVNQRFPSARVECRGGGKKSIQDGDRNQRLPG